MTPFSPGVLVGSFELMRLIARCPTPLFELPASFSRLGGVDIGDVLTAAQYLNWVQADTLGNAILTPSGQELLKLTSHQLQMRSALLQYIDVAQPPWLQFAIQGRLRIRTFAGSTIAQIIDEAGLTTGDDIDVVRFWDDLAARARGMRSDRLTEIGRQGERLSMENERRRTLSEPKWVSLDSNVDGYDILSVVGRNDSRKLSIEVKATTAQSEATFHVTANEWQRASDAEAHAFHLWNLGRAQPELMVISVDQMEPHIPTSRGNGEWESAAIKFAAFV